jgi:hypothetical protein
MLKKRLILLTRDDFEARYVANVLSAAVEMDCIVVDRRPKKANVRRAFRRGFSHFISKAARTVFLRMIGDDAARARILSDLFGKSGQSFAAPGKVRIVNGINSEECIALVRQVDPDAILVYGTSVVKDSVLSLAREICLNMHTGISPHYRGTACAFWPVVNGELDMLGATIHECTSHIDGGAIFEIARVQYQAGDDLHALFGRVVVAGAKAYVNVVRRYLAGELRGEPQNLLLGAEYSGSELTLVPELKARLRLARMART